MGSMKLSLRSFSVRFGISLHNYDRVIIQFKWDESSCEIDDVTFISEVTLSSNLGNY